MEKPWQQNRVHPAGPRFDPFHRISTCLPKYSKPFCDKNVQVRFWFTHKCNIPEYFTTSQIIEKDVTPKFYNFNVFLEFGSLIMTQEAVLPNVRKYFYFGNFLILLKTAKNFLNPVADRKLSRAEKVYISKPSFYVYWSKYDVCLGWCYNDRLKTFMLRIRHLSSSAFANETAVSE